MSWSQLGSHSPSYLFLKSHPPDSYQGLCTHQASLTSIISLHSSILPSGDQEASNLPRVT